MNFVPDGVTFCMLSPQEEDHNSKKNHLCVVIITPFRALNFTKVVPPKSNPIHVFYQGFYFYDRNRLLKQKPKYILVGSKRHNMTKQYTHNQIHFV